MRKYALILLLPLTAINCSDAPPSVSSGRTVEDAHEFLKAAYERAQAMRNAAFIDNNRQESYSGSECKTAITLSITQDDKTVTTLNSLIDWRLVSKVSSWSMSESGGRVKIDGSIVSELISVNHPESNKTYTDQELVANWRSFEDAERVASAMELLRTSCDKSRKFGF